MTCKMWTRECSKVYQNVKKEDVWRLWTDINNWPKWHGELDYCKLEGEFIVGNKFRLKPKGAPSVKIKLIAIEDGKEFIDCTKFFGAKMFDAHQLEETKDGLRLTNTVIVTGLLKFLWIKLVARNVADTAEQKMDALVALARSANA